MALIDANGNYFSELPSGRVKYNLEYNDGTGLYRMPKAPELIKIANVVALDVFFDSGSDYDPVWFDSSLILNNYGDQVFFNATTNSNFVWLSQAVTGDCLTAMQEFINGGIMTDIGDGDIIGDGFIIGD